MTQHEYTVVVVNVVVYPVVVVVVVVAMPLLRSYMTVLGNFFEYDTAKVVHIPSKKVGIVNRCIQATILFYIILYVRELCSFNSLTLAVISVLIYWLSVFGAML